MKKDMDTGKYMYSLTDKDIIDSAMIIVRAIENEIYKKSIPMYFSFCESLYNS